MYRRKNRTFFTVRPPQGRVPPPWPPARGLIERAVSVPRVIKSECFFTPFNSTSLVPKCTGRKKFCTLTIGELRGGQKWGGWRNIFEITDLRTRKPSGCTLGVLYRNVPSKKPHFFYRKASPREGTPAMAPCPWQY